MSETQSLNIFLDMICTRDKLQRLCSLCLLFPSTFISSAIHILSTTNLSQATHPSIFQTIHDDIVSRRFPPEQM